MTRVRKYTRQKAGLEDIRSRSIVQISYSSLTLIYTLEKLLKKAIETCSHDRDSIAQFTYTADEITKMCRNFNKKKNPEKLNSSFFVEENKKLSKISHC